MLAPLADAILAVRRPHPVRVALDGVDAAGKTTLADELARGVGGRGRPVIRASVDDFLRPRAERYRRGPDSPEGYYEDTFDYPALRAALLTPLGPDGDRRYRTAAFDLATDTPLDAPPREAPTDAVALVDGVFLQRPELAGCWDLRVFVDVDLEEAMRRAEQRDRARFGSAAAVRERYARRYTPAQRRYLQTQRPRERADVIVENTDPARPRLVVPLTCLPR